MSDHTADAPNILIVDDTLANLRLLSGILNGAGYAVRPALSGALAVAAAETWAPDLVLLDINMPGMDGYEVCRQLKADPDLARIPVIFLSALSETDDKLKAFEAGGVDYITKPFQRQEVCARVDTHLRIHRLQVDLEETIQQLHAANELRESLVHMIVHDLRSPLSGVLASLQLMERDWDSSDEEAKEDLERAIDSSRAMSRMINSLLDVAKMECGDLEVTRSESDLGLIAEEAVRVLSGLARGVSVVIERPDVAVNVQVDEALVVRVFENLLANALRYTPKDGVVTILVSSTPTGARIEVTDTGIGIPEEFRSKIFEKFGQVEAREHRARAGTGLGLAFCKLAIEAHGGSIGVESKVGEGSTFWVDLPADS